MNPTSHVIHEPCDHVDARIVEVDDWAYDPQTNEAVGIHARVGLLVAIHGRNANSHYI